MIARRDQFLARQAPDPSLGGLKFRSLSEAGDIAGDRDQIERLAMGERMGAGDGSRVFRPEVNVGEVQNPAVQSRSSAESWGARARNAFTRNRNSAFRPRDVGSPSSRAGMACRAHTRPWPA